MIEMGKQYQTRDGREVRIYAVDAGGEWPVHGAVEFDGGWQSASWTSCGKHFGRTLQPNDLIEVKPTITRTYWLVFCGHPLSGQIKVWGVNPRDHSDRHDMPPHTITGPHTITFTEGEGL